MFLRSTASAIASASKKSLFFRFHERLNKLGSHQPDIVPLLPKRTAQEVSAGAGFPADQRRLHPRGECQQLLICELLPH
jgi:hypothetical protein